MISLTIDNKVVQVDKKVTILEAARKAGINIPTLCYHKSLLPFGACRICVVELKTGSATSLQAACVYPVEEGIEVATKSPLVLKTRKMVVELLLARCPEVDAVQYMGKKLGVANSRLPAKLPMEEKCILCGRCVRVCREIIGKSVVSFAHRGYKRKVSTPFEIHSEVCIGCTACAFICPTGAIKVKQDINKTAISPWNTELEHLHCSKCGKTFLPYKLAEHVQKLLHPQETADFTNLCPKCRMKKTAGLAAGINIGAF